MFVRNTLILSLAFVFCTVSASADPFVYVVTGNQQFGTVDLTSGVFTQIGPNMPDFGTGLVGGPNGSLLTLTVSGNLDAINPVTGLVTFIGATGLADCSTPSSACGPTSANTLGELGGTVYATDLSNNLYTVNPLTGLTTLIGPTGIPAVPAIPDSINPDGTLNAFDEALFGANGNLYATFDAIQVNFSPFTVTPVVSPALYQIDPSTGVATLIHSTALTLGAAVQENGTIFAFENMDSEVLALDLANGGTSAVGGFDPAAGLIEGAAAAVPEPASIAMACLGIAACVVRKRRKGGLRSLLRPW
jgi:hypothetical protein